MEHNKKTATAQVSIMEYIDVRDKKLLYLVVEKDGIKVAINIGEKSYKTMGELIEHKPAEQPKLEGWNKL